MDAKNLQERLRSIFPEPHRHGLKKEIADLCGVKAPSVSQWFKNPEKVSSLDRDAAEAICAKYAPTISPIWLASGKGEPTANLPAPLPTVEAPESAKPLSIIRPAWRPDIIEIVEHFRRYMQGVPDNLTRQAVGDLIRVVAVMPETAADIAQTIATMTGGAQANRAAAR